MYEEFYGLEARPFQLTPDPAYYFESASHRKALSYLGYGLAQGEGFIVITGEIGAGKSTFVAHLIERIDPAQLMVAKLVAGRLDAQELVRETTRAFGLDVTGEDKGATLSAIERLLEDGAREGRRCLLIVDEAQNLDIDALEVLRALSNLQLGSQPLLQVLLLGQPEFREMLDTHPRLEQLRQRVIARHHIDAMRADEIEPYVLHRMRRAGWSGDPALPTDMFDQIHDASGGIPRLVNHLMNRLLLLGAVEERRSLDTEMVGEVVDDLDDERAPASDDVDRRTPDAPSVRESDAMFEVRDRQIRELQQAIVELEESIATASRVQPGTAPDDDRFGRAETRLDEQERTVRYMLTMLIEWLEDEQPRIAA